MTHLNNVQFCGVAHIPWNKGKLIGARPPLKPKQVWAIRARLQIAGRIRDLALFNLAIDSKLRGCDLVRLKVSDVAPAGCTLDRASIRQKKTGRPVKFEITEQTRQAIPGTRRIRLSSHNSTIRPAIVELAFHHRA